MNKKNCREALDVYKKFLARMDRVCEFLKVAEVCVTHAVYCVISWVKFGFSFHRTFAIMALKTEYMFFAFSGCCVENLL